MPTRHTAAIALAAASASVVVGATIWSWNTSDYWETVPVISCLAAAGTLAGLAYYAWRGWSILAFLVAAGVALTTFIVTLYAALRWTS